MRIATIRVTPTGWVMTRCDCISASHVQCRAYLPIYSDVDSMTIESHPHATFVAVVG